MISIPRIPDGDRTLRVYTAPGAKVPFCAGAIMRRSVTMEWKCIRAAPILKWMVGRYADENLADELRWRKLAWEWVR